MKTLGLENEFIEYLKSRPSLPIVTFSKVIDSRMVCFGWCHKPVQIRTRRRRSKFIQSEKKINHERYTKLLDEKTRLFMYEDFLLKYLSIIGLHTEHRPTMISVKVAKAPKL